MVDLTGLYLLPTEELIRIAHAVAAVLRERAQAAPLIAEEDDGFHDQLIEAGRKGVPIGVMRAVLVKLL